MNKANHYLFTLKENFFFFFLVLREREKERQISGNLSVSSEVTGKEDTGEGFSASPFSNIYYLRWWCGTAMLMQEISSAGELCLFQGREHIKNISILH